MSEQDRKLPDSVEFAGFWVRCGALVIDTMVLLVITVPISVMIYGSKKWLNGSVTISHWDLLINWLFPVIFVILFWRLKGATPGKMVAGVKVVDAKTGLVPGAAQSIRRYFGYFLSMIPFMLGFLWIAIDKKKQGWHDKIAGTVVIRIKKEQKTTETGFIDLSE